jgi:hypothetical protein
LNVCSLPLALCSPKADVAGSLLFASLFNFVTVLTI